MNGAYICIDLKSYYASVECVARGLDPLKANLLVADPSRSDQTICLAVSPALKAIGVPSRPRLFEAKQAIRLYEAQHHTKISYITAVPRMAEYERISSKIYDVYQKYVSPEDILVYSIDECFIDCSRYLEAYAKEAEESGLEPAHVMAVTIIRKRLMVPEQIPVTVFIQLRNPDSVRIRRGFFRDNIHGDLGQIEVCADSDSRGDSGSP